MWEEITTISEIDTIKAGTLLSKENPGDNSGVVYKVTQINTDEVMLMPKGSIDYGDNFALKPEALFAHGWWMLKKDE